MEILPVSAVDAAELLEIYGPYVQNTAISFEYEIPTTEEFSQRILRISEKYPYFKAVENGRILGYAYAATFKPRPAYDWSVEVTIYVRSDRRKRGVGSALYRALESSLRDMGVLNMNACIAVPRGEDPHLTMDSPRFHEKMGFSMVGTFHNSGYKFHTWYDMIWMEKSIGQHTENQPPVKFGAK